MLPYNTGTFLWFEGSLNFTEFFFKNACPTELELGLGLGSGLCLG